MALLALTEALNHSGLRELLKRRLQVATEDHLELVCSVNAILKLLELIYKVLNTTVIFVVHAVVFHCVVHCNRGGTSW